MIVVLDTNVIVSALLSRSGPPAEILRRWEAGAFDIASSPALLAELQRVLSYPRVTRYLRAITDPESFVAGMRANLVMVEPVASLDIVQDDPDDNRLLECAIAAGASILVSGDTHLPNLKRHREVEVLNPAAFLLLLGE